MEPQTRGVLLAFEGLDKTGKTTQSKLLLDNLNKITKVPTVLVKFPCTDTKIGSILKRHLTKKIELEPHVVQLLFSANRWEMQKIILDHLKDGTNVLLDRYLFSGLAYGLAQEIDRSWLETLDTGLVLPDFIYYFYVPVAEYDNEIYENSKFQGKLNAIFLDVLKDTPYFTFPYKDKTLCEKMIHNYSLFFIDKYSTEKLSFKLKK